MTQQGETKARAGAVIVPVTLFEQNCTLIWCEATKKAVVIDPGGDHATLIRSIKDKLLPLGDDVGFICGHGPGSSIGQERMTNPFLTGAM